MAFRTCSINDRRRRGFSIAEGLMASTVLAIAVIGIAGPLCASSEQSKMLQEKGVAITLARELLEEIASKPLQDGGTTCHLGPESGETKRALYDSADDYNGYSDSSDSLKALDGSTISIGSGLPYTRSVTVEYRTTPAGAATTSGDFGLVTVTVTSPHKVTVKISKLLTKTSISS